MKVLLTGAAGYLGATCLARLRRAGCEIFATDLRTPSEEPTIPHAASAHWTAADLTDPAAVGRLIERAKPDAVIHLAGVLDAGEARLNPAKYFLINTAASFHLLESACRFGVSHFVFASSNAVYGLPPSSPVVEDMPLAPRNPYGESKAVVDRALSWFTVGGLPSCAVLRFFNLAGGNEFSRLRGSWSGALSTRLLSAALGEIPELNVFGTDYPTPDGSCQRDFLHVDDAARAVVCALERRAVGPFNIAGGRPVSVLEAIAAFRTATARPIPWRDQGRRPGEVPVLVASIARARLELGWTPQLSAINEIARSAWQSVPSA